MARKTTRPDHRRLIARAVIERLHREADDPESHVTDDAAYGAIQLARALGIDVWDREGEDADPRNER
jgi:hypothetical protein